MFAIVSPTTFASEDGKVKKFKIGSEDASFVAKNGDGPSVGIRVKPNTDPAKQSSGKWVELTGFFFPKQPTGEWPTLILEIVGSPGTEFTIQTSSNLSFWVELDGVHKFTGSLSDGTGIGQFQKDRIIARAQFFRVRLIPSSNSS